MPAGSRRFRRDDLVAGAWHWLLLILLLLLIVPLPGRVPLHTRSAAYTSRSSAATTAVRFAGDQLGERYQWGGAGPLAYDCSGLTMMAYRSAGVRIPRVSRWQYEVGQRVAVRQLVPGDLVFYARNPGDPSTIDRVGMYLAAGRMVEAANRSAPVRTASIWRGGLMRYGVRPAPSSPRMLGVVRHGQWSPARPRCRPACGPPAPAWRWTAPSVRSRWPPCGASSTPMAWPQTARSAAPPGKRWSATDASGAARRAAERSTSTTRSGRGAVRSDRVAKPRRRVGPAPARAGPPAAVPPPWIRTQTGPRGPPDPVARWPSPWGPSPRGPPDPVARWQGMRRASGRADVGDRGGPDRGSGEGAGAPSEWRQAVTVMVPVILSWRVQR
jgi:NlpC/P60 family